jgi:hypothetical protein
VTREQILSLPKPLRVVAQFVAPTGQHRPRGAIVGTRFVDCTPCGVSTVASVHGGTVLCAEGHQQPVGGAA